MNFDTSFDRLLEKDPSISFAKKGFPSIGRRQDEADFSASLQSVVRCWKNYDYELYNQTSLYSKILNFATGNPIKEKAYSLPCEMMKRLLKGKKLFEYQSVAGNNELRKKIVPYLDRLGIKPEKGIISEENIISTVSTTQAFSIILDVITRPYDVILFAAPTYGLFLFMPERINAYVEFLPLEEKDNWYINPTKLEAKIKEINCNLRKKYLNKFNYIPQVVAFVNINPHNPTGKVMSEEHSYLLKRIGKICLKNNVFIIDDLIYRDLGFNSHKLAKPIASYPELFQNTISMFGLSKSYNLAAIRSGMIVASEPLIRAFRNRLFHLMDSSPILQTAALAGAFDVSKKGLQQYDKYFSKIKKEYLYRFHLFKALIEGLDSVSDEHIKQQIDSELLHFLNKQKYEQMKRKSDIHIVKGMEPESGYFVLLDFTFYRGKKYKEYEINSETDLLFFLYHFAGIKFIMGQSIAWPDDKLIGRFSFSLDRKDIVLGLTRIRQTLNKLS